MVQSIIQIKCSCNEYPWGKQGSKSLAAVLAAQTPGTDFKLDENKVYSEMWMGTYPELPSYVLETGEDLQDVLDKNADQLIGQGVQKKFGHTKLPYLPKILSISKALPLQVHPNIGLASELHRKDPQNFTDPNHKPEIALALGPFEAFCGFKPLPDIKAILDLEPLQRFLPQIKKPEFDDQSLKHTVRAILSASDDVIKSTQEALGKLPKKKLGKQGYILDLLPRLQQQYEKTDPGTVVALITMNYLQLQAGDSIYIPADGIHAYLAGDIIECMARSNNVLNTGFCPRAERNNVDMFCETLTFTPHDKEEAMLRPEDFKRAKNGKTKLYAPPLSEFSTLALDLKREESEEWESLGGPQVLVVTKGKAKLSSGDQTVELSKGYTFFVGVGTPLKFEASEDLQAFAFFAE